MPDTSTTTSAPQAADSALMREVAELVVTSLNLETSPADIQPDDPLYGDGLGLDSIDILEIALVVSKRYGLQLRADHEDNTANPHPDLFDAAVAIAPLLGLAVLLAWRSPQRPWMLLLCLASCAALYATSNWLVQHFNWVFLLQHAGMQALLGLAFGRSLRAGQVPMVSRFAAVVHGSLSPALARYTRQVTWAWTLYFAVMTTLSLLLFWLAPVAVWSVLANLLNLPLLILMFAAEYGARLYFLAPSDRAGPLEAIRAYRQAGARTAPPP